MKNPLVLLFFLLFSACDAPPSDADRTPDKRFRTTQPSRLYFKNMRAYYYNQEVQPGTKVDLYTLKKFSQSDNIPLLIPTIADNWLQDEAYIFLYPNANEAIAVDTLQLKWEAADSEEQGTFSLTDETVLEQFELANWLYEHLSNGHKIRFLGTDNEWHELFTSQENRLNFIKTMQDYYALIEQDNQ